MDKSPKRSPLSPIAKGPSSQLKAALWVLLLLLPSAAFSFTIYFLNGGEMEVKQAYTIQGDKALVTKLSGEQTTIDLALIDQEKTERNNVGRLSDVVVIDTTGTRRFQPGSSQGNRRTTLRDAIQRGDVGTRDLTAEATNGNGTSAGNSTVTLPLTRGGFPDLDQLLREPVADAELENRLNSSMRAIGVSKFRLYRGSSSNRLMVEITADGRFEVFNQLKALGEAYSLATQRSPYQALEVLMLTKNRTRSGQFVLTQENAPLLADELLTPSEFFLQYVQF